MESYFDHYDNNKDDVLDLAELKNLSSNLGTNVTGSNWTLPRFTDWFNKIIPLPETRTAFKLFDKNKNFKTDRSEFRDLLKSRGIRGLEKKQLDSIFTAYDRNGDKVLDVQEIKNIFN